jgi:hypothetical protein
MKVIISTFLISILLTCSSSNGPENTPEFTSAYFPIGDGDTWYFSTSTSEKITRTIDGDTTINNVQCLRVLENGRTAEAWSITESGDSAGFYVHLLLLKFANDTVLTRFEPPLRIPLEMEKSDLYEYSSTGYYTLNSEQYFFSINGSLQFLGFIDKTVAAGSFENVIDLYYINDDYHEYYAEGVGLLDNEDYVLDSAFIDGVWIK